MLHNNRDISLTAAIDFAAGGRQFNAVRHFAVDELFIQVIHQRFHHTRCIGTGNIAVQPALGMRNHGNRVCRSANWEAIIEQRLDQWLNLLAILHHIFNIGAGGEAYKAFSKFIGNIGQFANGVSIHLTCRSGLNGPDFIATFCTVIQNTGFRMVVVNPLTIVLNHGRVHVRYRIRNAGFYRCAHFCHLLSSLKRISDNGCELTCCLTLVPLFHFLIPTVHPCIWVVTWFEDHIWIHFEADTIQEINQTNAVDHFTGTLML